MSMEVIKSVKISISLDDIIQYIHQMTKQQIVQKFKVLLYHKQTQINDKIEKLNAQHLLVLQKKMVLVQKKQQQIIKLNNTITLYKNQINEQKMKTAQIIDDMLQLKEKALSFEKTKQEFEQIYNEKKQEISELKKIKKEMQMKLTRSEDLRKQLQRQIKRLKQDKLGWGDNTNMLLNNQKKVLEQRHKKKLKTIIVQRDYRINNLGCQVQENKKIISQKDKKLAEEQKINQRLRKKFNKLQALQMQTQEPSSKVQFSKHTKSIQIQATIQTKQTNTKQVQLAHKQVNVNIQCNNCQLLKTQIQKLSQQTSSLLLASKKTSHSQKPIIQAFSISTQTFQNPTQHSSVQTMYKVQQPQLQIYQIGQIRRIIEISMKQKQIIQNRYNELQQLYISRPRRPEDIKQITKLKKQLMGTQIKILELQNQVQSLQNLTNSLDFQISSRDQIIKTLPIEAIGQPCKKSQLSERISSLEAIFSYQSFKKQLRKRNILSEAQQNQLNAVSDIQNYQSNHQKLLCDELTQKGISLRNNPNNNRKSVSQEGQRPNLYRKYKSPNRSFHKSGKKF